MERDEQLAASRIPELHLLVNAPAGQRHPPSIKSHAKDPALVPVEPGECTEQAATSRFPELYGVVVTPAGQRPAQRIKRHAQDPAPVPFERAEQLHARW